MPRRALPSLLRRHLLGAAVGAAALLACSGAVTTTAPAPSTPRIEALLDTVSRRTFDFFWERTDARTGLTPDRWPTQSFSSIAAVGFALTAYPIGAERGYITRDAAAERVLTTLRFFYQLPQGPAASGIGPALADWSPESSAWRSWPPASRGSSVGGL